jgi:hypothetical protein
MIKVPRRLKPIPVLRYSDFGGKSFFHKSEAKQKEIVIRRAKLVGEKRIIGKLKAIQVLNKNRNPGLSKKAKKLSLFVANSFRGNQRARTGTELSD